MISMFKFPNSLIIFSSLKFDKSTQSALESGKFKEKVSLIGMGQKFEVWNEKNWLAKEKGQQIQGEKLDIDLPSNVQEIPF